MVKVEELPEVENQVDRIRMLKENGLIPDDIDRIPWVERLEEMQQCQ